MYDRSLCLVCFTRLRLPFVACIGRFLSEHWLSIRRLDRTVLLTVGSANMKVLCAAAALAIAATAGLRQLPFLTYSICHDVSRRWWCGERLIGRYCVRRMLAVAVSAGAAGAIHPPRTQSTRNNCHPYLGNATLCMSSLDHGPWSPPPTADPVYTQQLSYLPRQYYTLHVEFGPPTMDSTTYRGPSLHATIVILTQAILYFACRVCTPCVKQQALSDAPLRIEIVSE